MIPSAAVMTVFDTVGARAHSESATLRRLAVTSSIREEGTSTVALGTALSFAGFDPAAMVLLVDANWLHPSLSERSGRGSARGLAECLRDGSSVMRVIATTERRGLSFLPAGQVDGEMPPLGGITALLEELEDHFTKVVIDLPPVMVAPSLAVPWVKAVDQTYLVVRRGATPVSLIRKAMSELGGVRAPQLILNRSRESWMQLG